jgi:hypothetical protein
MQSEVPTEDDPSIAMPIEYQSYADLTPPETGVSDILAQL